MIIVCSLGDGQCLQLKGVKISESELSNDRDDQRDLGSSCTNHASNGFHAPLSIGDRRKCSAISSFGLRRLHLVQEAMKMDQPRRSTAAAVDRHKPSGVNIKGL